MKFLGWLSIFIFIFSLLNYILNDYFHYEFFTSFYAPLIRGVLPLLGMIFGIWSFGWRRLIGLLGNAAVFSVTIILPLVQFFF